MDGLWQVKGVAKGNGIFNVSFLDRRYGSEKG